MNIGEDDEKISLVGRVIEVKENSFILEDDVGKIEIKSNFNVNDGEIVRVFCNVENGNITAEIVQDMNNLDLNLYKKVDSIFHSI